MTTYLSRYIRYLGPLLGLSALLLANQVHALGLGSLKVLSALDEPLVAEIELTAVEDGALESLQVILGSQEAFNQAGIRRESFLRDLEFTLVKGATPKIRIVTTQPIKEPFLHFLVNAEWDDGNLLREYTALLDPPLYATNQPTAVSSPGLVEQAENMAASPPTGSTSGGTSAAGTAGPQSGTAPVFSSAEYGPTAKGDTLWSIASQFDTSGYNVNVFQVIAALLKENPDAFIDNNINRMKTGQILRLSDLDAVGKEDASRMYQAQMDQWESYKMEVAKNSELVSVPAAASSTESASPPTAAKTAESDPAAMADADDSEVTTTSSSEQDLLKIVRATLEEEAGQNEGAGKESAADAARADSAEEIGALREQITTLEESLVSTELQNRELQERVTLLEDQVVNAQRLVELESQELALVQQQAAQQQEERQLLEQQLLEQQAQADQALDEAEKAAAEQEAADKADAELAVANQQAAAEQAAADKAEAELAAANQQAAAEKAQVEKELVEKAQAEKAQAEKAQAEKVAAEQKAAADKASAEAKEVATTQQGEAASGEQATPVSTAQEQPAAAAKGKKTRIDSRKDDTTAAQKVARGPEPESWWQNIIDTIAGSSMSLIAGAVGLVVLLVAAILFIRRRRSIAEFEESILSGSGLNGQTDTTDTSAANPAGTDTSFLSDFGMAGMGSMQADEVDPLAEADVYLAYGRDEQAEEVLKEAVARDPGRYELKLKLLEIYQQRDDLKSFETLAEELYPAGGQGDPVTWAKVIKMGNKMNPHNPLFAQELSGGMADTVTSDDLGGPGSISLDLSGPPDVATMSDTELPQNIVGQSLGPIDPALHPFPAPDNNAGVDEELGRDVVQADSTSSRAGDADELKPLSSSEDPSDDDLPDFASNEKSDLGFEFELKGLDEALAKGTDNEPDELNMDDLIQLDIDEPKLQTNSLGTDDGQDGQSMDEESGLRMEEPDDASGAEELRTVPRDDVSREGVPREDDSREDDSREDDSREDVTRNFGVISGGGGAAGEAIGNGDAKDTATNMETWDEAATKLDLAQAYLNMGDKAGARSIIDEVIKEGSPAQKNQAAELEAQLG